MRQRFHDFRTLDKDLGRLSATERAGLQTARPVLRLGAAAVFVAAMMLVGMGALAGHAMVATVAAGVAMAAYLALAIGANDVANALGPAVGAGALKLGTGLVMVAAAEVAGVLLAGQRVSTTLSMGIVDPARMLDGAPGATLMLAALLAAAIWVNLATWAGAPVSTTHAVVGGIAGAGLATFGVQAVNWPGIAMIAGGWMVSPFAAGLAAAALLALLRWRVDRAPDPVAAARRWLPGMIAAMAGLGVLYLCGALLGRPGGPSAVLAGAVAVAAFILARARLDVQIAGARTRREALRNLFGLPLALVAVLMGFAHGANDASNVTAPLGVIVQVAGISDAAASTPHWVALVAGGGLALGALLFGRRLVVMVGSKITRLNPVRAFCVALATGITVLAASWLGMPVSTTHVAVGGVFGVGFYREWEDARRKRRRAALPPEERHRRTLVRRAHVRRILGAWVITLPASAALAAVFVTVIP